jgi:hypothetical protein
MVTSGATIRNARTSPADNEVNAIRRKRSLERPASVD